LAVTVALFEAQPLGRQGHDPTFAQYQKGMAGPRMQDAVDEVTEQPHLLPLFYSEKGMSRSGWVLSIDISFVLAS